MLDLGLERFGKTDIVGETAVFPSWFPEKVEANAKTYLRSGFVETDETKFNKEFANNYLSDLGKEQLLPNTWLGETRASYQVRYVNGEFWLIGYSGLCSRSKDGYNWEQVYVSSSLVTGAIALQDITYGQGYYLTICSGQYWYISQDGNNWNAITNPLYSTAASALPRCVSYQNGYWVVGCTDNYVLYTNGSIASTTWTILNKPNGYSISCEDITWDGSNWIMCGDPSIVIATGGGNPASWGKLATPADAVGTFDSIACSYPTYTGSAVTVVATGRHGTTLSPMAAYRKGDGVWHTITVPSQAGANSSRMRFERVVWSGNKFITISDNGLFISTDGVTWTFESFPEPLYHNGLAAVGDLIVAGGISGASNGQVQVGTSAANLKSVFPGFVNHGTFEFLKKVNTLYFGTGLGFGGYTVSSDGVNWDYKSVPTTTYATTYAVCWTGTKYIMSTAYGGELFTSTDGNTWTLATNVNATVGHDAMNMIAYVGNKIVLINMYGIWTCPDNGSWAWSRSSVAARTSALNSVSISGGIIYLLNVGDFGSRLPSILLSSADNGVTWKVVDIPNDAEAARPRRITTIGSYLYMITWDNAVYRTSDGGVTWSKFTVPVVGDNQSYPLYLMGIVAYDDYLVLIGGNSSPTEPYGISLIAIIDWDTNRSAVISHSRQYAGELAWDAIVAGDQLVMAGGLFNVGYSQARMWKTKLTKGAGMLKQVNNGYGIKYMRIK